MGQRSIKKGNPFSSPRYAVSKAQAFEGVHILWAPSSLLSQALFTLAAVNTIDQEIRASDPRSLQCYLQGALRDGTASPRHGTHRFGQSDPQWLECLRVILAALGHRSWLYREGRSRRFWILETAASFLDVSFEAAVLEGKPEARAFARGYFDADGGMPLTRGARLYLQFTQKNRPDLDRLRDLLEADGIACGRIHNPSRRVDPDYWRFFVRAQSQMRFLFTVGSWHPRKRSLMDDRLQKQVAAFA